MDAQPSAARIEQMGLNAGERGADLRDVPLLESADVASVVGSVAKNRAAAAHKLGREGRVFSIRVGRRDLYPAFQFGRNGRPLDGIVPVLARLREAGLSGWGSRLVDEPNDLLASRRPAEVIRTDPELVAVAAAAEDEIPE